MDVHFFYYKLASVRVDLEWIPSYRVSTDYVLNHDPDRHPMPNSNPDAAFGASHSFVSLYHETHSTDVAFGRRCRRTFLTQIVSQISATMFE
ncbi:hypothetical protein EVAR_7142_1 [Eumeta japonica]|uniref:Uncharacterized protein n=1 Tax=Eumeta variegata TaxID=151549 RepID=A0A4C1U6J6_EUMVA|nr:hypothetical protein EVAR_7142_1 [Eumeta japonica]